MKISDIHRINKLLMKNKWLLDSVKAIITSIPGNSKFTLADGFVLVLRGMIRTNVRIQEIFAAKEPTINPNDPRFISEMAGLLRENMNWIRPLVEKYTPVDYNYQEDNQILSSIEELFATAKECSTSEH